jgi:hypothetical protein
MWFRVASQFFGSLPLVLSALCAEYVGSVLQQGPSIADAQSDLSTFWLTDEHVLGNPRADKWMTFHAIRNACFRYPLSVPTQMPKAIAARVSAQFDSLRNDLETTVDLAAKEQTLERYRWLYGNARHPVSAEIWQRFTYDPLPALCLSDLLSHCLDMLRGWRCDLRGRTRRNSRWSLRIITCRNGT